MKNNKIKSFILAFCLIFALGSFNDAAKLINTQSISAKKAKVKITKYKNKKRKTYKKTTYYKNYRINTVKSIKYKSNGKRKYYSYTKYYKNGRKKELTKIKYHSNGKQASYQKATYHTNKNKKSVTKINYAKNGKRTSYQYNSFFNTSSKNNVTTIKYNHKGQITYKEIKNYRKRSYDDVAYCVDLKLINLQKYWYVNGKLANNAKHEYRTYYENNGTLKSVTKYKYTTNNKRVQYYHQTYKNPDAKKPKYGDWVYLPHGNSIYFWQGVRIIYKVVEKNGKKEAEFVTFKIYYFEKPSQKEIERRFEAIFKALETAKKPDVKNKKVGSEVDMHLYFYFG